MKRKGKLRARPQTKKPHLEIFRSFAELDQADRDYWLSVSPAERLRALELTRQATFGYGNGRALPPFQRVLEIIKPR